MPELFSFSLGSFFFLFSRYRIKIEKKLFPSSFRFSPPGRLRWNTKHTGKKASCEKNDKYNCIPPDTHIKRHRQAHGSRFLGRGGAGGGGDEKSQEGRSRTNMRLSFEWKMKNLIRVFLLARWLNDEVFSGTRLYLLLHTRQSGKESENTQLNPTFVEIFRTKIFHSRYNKHWICFSFSFPS